MISIIHWGFLSLNKFVDPVFTLVNVKGPAQYTQINDDISIYSKFNNNFLFHISVANYFYYLLQEN